MKPFAFTRGYRLSVYPIGLRNAVTPDENLPGVVELDFASRQCLSDRAAAQFERMVETHQRSSFGKPITLNYSEPESSPELFVIVIEGGPAADDRPKLPSESGMDTAKTPPAPAEVFVPGFFHLRAQPSLSNRGAQLRLKHLAHRAEQARDGDQN